MAERLKKEIVTILKSEEIRSFFQEMLNEHTNQIMETIQKGESETLAEELSVRKELEKELASVRMQLETVSEEREQLAHERNKEQEKTASLNEELHSVESQLRERQEAYGKMEAYYKEREKQADIALEELRQEVGKYSKYKEIENAFSVYTALPEDIKNRAENIFGTGTIYGFLSSMNDWANVDGMWNFAKTRVIEYEDQEARHLVSLFCFLFGVYHSQNITAEYELISPEAGEKYNSDIHSIKGSKTDGYIAEMLMPGIYDSKIKKVIHKAIVKVQ